MAINFPDSPTNGATFTNNGITWVYSSSLSSWRTQSSSNPPGGSNTHVLFNDSGSAGGNGGFTYDKSTNNVVIANTITVGNSSVNAVANSSYLKLNGQISANGGVGTAGQVLTSGAAGNIYWSTVSGGGGSLPTTIALQNTTSTATASGANSISIGANTGSASIAESIAIGANAAVTTGNSIAIGYNITAASNGVAIGHSHTNINNYETTAVGYIINGGGGARSTLIGARVTAGSGFSTALGAMTSLTGTGPVAVGYGTNATNTYATAVGANSSVSGAYSISIGYNANTSGTNSISVGVGSAVSGNNSFAFGPNNTVSGNNSGAIGYGISVTTSNTIIIGNTSQTVTVNGTFTAITKSFNIPHPSVKGKRLVYGSLEGPEHGVYLRGRLTEKNVGVIQLPYYWKDLIDPTTVTVQLTPIGSFQKLYVDSIADDYITVRNDGLIDKSVLCFYVVYGERKDVSKLVVEPDGNV